MWDVMVKSWTEKDVRTPMHDVGIPMHDVRTSIPFGIMRHPSATDPAIDLFQRAFDLTDSISVIMCCHTTSSSYQHVKKDDSLIRVGSDLGTVGSFAD